ncbi:hypothetical protein Rsub_01129 [Raphidocelis subcapitata]|uniref:Nuclear condensin complex subunit 3 C-terminal domain-containing protein n=1 Tax=Raphidocelis subcapitata TaxID=307507 RepID=A0A2V0NU18_9CHLO|nr:hypothetical protein Rsub_01129 [Raphidocelis subcapitata]|eukprot:GBF88417.1 hypothetical protein Rsub_01129 [Raphidocelis subcapitata]
MPSLQAEVGSLFNAVQRSSVATERCVRQFWKLVQQEPEEAARALGSCVELVLAAPRKAPNVERCVRFLGALAALAPAGATGEALTEALFRQLSSHLEAADRGVRFRAAQALAITLQALPPDACVDEDLAAELSGRLRERLNDKVAEVRLCAARALGRLPAPDESGGYASDPAAQALSERLAWERSKDVRAAVLQALPLAPDTLPALLERLRDVSPSVRLAVVARLFAVPMSLLTIRQRAELVGTGLRDRDAGVREAAAEGVARWLREDSSGDALKLLGSLDVETHADAAALALEGLLESGAIDASALASSAAAEGRGLRAAAAAAQGSGGGKAVLEPAEALLWRVVCEWLHRTAVSEGLSAASTSGAAAAVRAAAATARHDALEASLPESGADVAALITAHTAAGPAARFAATQLASIAATCMDWADATGRASAAEALRNAIAADPGLEEGADGSEGPLLAGAGGDCAYEEAVVRVAARVHAGGAGDFVDAIASALSLMRERTGLAAGSDSPMAGAPAAAWRQALAYVRLTLRALPSRHVAGGRNAASDALAELWEGLLLPGVAHEDDCVRAAAIECVALYALAGASPVALPAALLMLRRALAGGEAPAVAAAAARGMSDLFLALGPTAVDGGLAAAGAAGAATAAGGSDARGAVQLLADAAWGVLEGARDRATPGPLDDAGEELLSAAAGGMSRALLHEAAWRAAGAATGASPADACPAGALQRALGALLLAHVHPATEGCPLLRQSLALFFEAYAAAGTPDRKRGLGAAALPAARAAHAIGGRAPAARQPAPMLLRFVLQLLHQGSCGTGEDAKQEQQGSGEKGQRDDGWGAAAFAQQLLTEAEHVWLVLLSRGVAPQRNRPYAAALIEVAQALPLRAGCEGLGVLLAMAQRLEDAVAADAALSKAAAGLLERLAALEADAAPAPSDADLEDVIDRLRGGALSREPALPGAAADSASGASQAPGTARKARVTRAASLVSSGSTPEVVGGGVQSALAAESSLVAATPPPPWVARRRGGTSALRSPSAPLSPAGSGDEAGAQGQERQPLGLSLSANTPAPRAAAARRSDAAPAKGATPAARRASSRSAALD